MALSLAGLLASLLGCEKGPAYEDTRHLENPPPKPPNCPDLPELKNITLKDGTIADVRIVQIGETKLYIPTNLVKGHFITSDDRRYRKFGTFPAAQIGIVQPYMIERECPGVVHKHAGNIYGRLSGFGIDFSEIDGRLLRNPVAPYTYVEPLNGVNFDGIFVQPSLPIEDGIGPWSFGLLPRAFVKYNEDIVASFTWNEAFSPIDKSVRDLTKDHKEWKNKVVKSERWAKSTRAVLDFVNWLATPPAKRNNDRKFDVKVTYK